MILIANCQDIQRTTKCITQNKIQEEITLLEHLFQFPSQFYIQLSESFYEYDKISIVSVTLCLNWFYFEMKSNQREH